MSPRLAERPQAAANSTDLSDLKRDVFGRVRAWETQFTQVLPSHINAKAWLATVVSALNKDTTGRLWEAAARDTDALLVALFRAAQMGLEPGTEQFYLTIRKGKIQGVPGYQGEIEMIYRAGAVSSVVVNVVRAGDTFRWRPGIMDRPDHEADWFGERGDLKGVYAYAVMKDGATSQVVLLGSKDIDEIRKASDGASSDYSPWKQWEESMWLKSAAHRLRKWVPTSSEFIGGQRRAIAGAEADVQGRAAIPEKYAAALDEYDEERPAITAPVTPSRGITAQPGPVLQQAAVVVEDIDPTLDPSWGGK